MRDMTDDQISKKHERIRGSDELKYPPNVDNLYPKYRCPVCGDWFYMPWKFCQCKRDEVARERKIRRLIRRALAEVFK